MKKTLALMGLVLTSSIFAQSNEEKRLKAAGDVLHEIMEVREKAIPQDLLDKSECAVVIPSLKKGAFIIGGKYGKGFFTCRNVNGDGWGSPASVIVEGGSVGFQVGGSESDVILLVIDRKSVV